MSCCVFDRCYMPGCLFQRRLGPPMCYKESPWGLISATVGIPLSAADVGREESGLKGSHIPQEEDDS